MAYTKPELEIPIKTGFIPVMESFYTIQGEGYYSGHAAYFIRLAGCDVGCSWCDVKESWLVEQNQLVNLDELVGQINNSKANRVVITGGEPFLHDLTDLTQKLRANDLSINLETSGSANFSGVYDWICLSPKKFKLPLAENYALADELKIIVVNNKDFEFAESEAAKVNEDCVLLLQPEWDKREKVSPLIVEYVKNNPRWKISIQTHKYLNIP